jgi:hypothetical protein
MSNKLFAVRFVGEFIQGFEKNNAAMILDEMGIAYESVGIETDARDLSAGFEIDLKYSGA